MASTGADAEGIRGALDGVRHVSWRSGRTFGRKHVVLLATAEVSPGTDGLAQVVEITTRLSQQAGQRSICTDRTLDVIMFR